MNKVVTYSFNIHGPFFVLLSVLEKRIETARHSLSFSLLWKNYDNNSRKQKLCLQRNARVAKVITRSHVLVFIFIYLFILQSNSINTVITKRKGKN